MSIELKTQTIDMERLKYLIEFGLNEGNAMFGDELITVKDVVFSPGMVIVKYTNKTQEQDR